MECGGMTDKQFKYIMHQQLDVFEEMLEMLDEGKTDELKKKIKKQMEITRIAVERT